MNKLTGQFITPAIQERKTIVRRNIPVKYFPINYEASKI